MKQIIPFSKDIVFKTNIASITSISLEHEEKIMNGEITGDFTVFGDYKIHNDTTERELFKYKLPFTALIPDNIIPSSVFIDVENFTYETIESDVLKVNIDFSIEGEESKEEQRLDTPQEPAEIVSSNDSTQEESRKPDTKEPEITNELNFFLDNKILSNLVDIEEKREKENREYIENKDTPQVAPIELLEESKEETYAVEKTNIEEIPKEEIEKEEEKIIIPTSPEILNEEPRFKEELKKSEESPVEMREIEEPQMQESDVTPTKKVRETPETPAEIHEVPTAKTPEKSEVNHENQSNLDNQRKQENKDSEELNKMVTEHEVNNEYVTYHIHIVSETETLDTIIKNYNCSLDTLNIYNDVTSLKAGDKLIIPEYLDE